MYEKWWKRFLLAVIVGIFLCNGLFPGVKAADMEDTISGPIMLVAHRAGAEHAPENTIAAIENAIAAGAVMAEIDVQQLKDGTLIVMHDSAFNRTAGVDKKVWEVDYQELQTFEAGSHYREAYRGERIPTLEEMLQCAKSRIRLMIELKYTGQEQELEEEVLRLLEQYHMKETCIVGSMNCGILDRMKELEPEIETVFITHNLTEEEYVLDYVDSYSIEARNLSVGMVERIHSQDKSVYGWTTNTMQAMRWVTDCGADGIITDNIYLGKIFLHRMY